MNINVSFFFNYIQILNDVLNKLLDILVLIINIGCKLIWVTSSFTFALIHLAWRHGPVCSLCTILHFKKTSVIRMIWFLKSQPTLSIIPRSVSNKPLTSINKAYNCLMKWESVCRFVVIVRSMADWRTTILKSNMIMELMFGRDLYTTSMAHLTLLKLTH